YMGLVYELKLIEAKETAVLLQWLRDDVASFEEIRYNHWVKKRLGICNPFLDRDSLCQSFQWLEDEELIGAIVRKQ
ncbi:MAG: hypothetical protein P1V97_32090, partial [Planctomycetota bacterium]|nr:hypothetical protein [Planctomycetota bacterium]